jgi:hypothetical protein
LRGKVIFWGGKIEFLKYCYLPMPLLNMYDDTK